MSQKIRDKLTILITMEGKAHNLPEAQVLFQDR